VGGRTFRGGGEECSLSTSPFGFKIMFLFVGQFEAIGPYPKHLKHLMELVLEPWEEFEFSWGTLGALDLGGWSLEDGFSSFFSFPFQVLE